MIEYILLFVFSLLITLLYMKISTTKNNKKSFLAIIVFTLFFLIQALRYDVGTDFLGTYTKEYNNILYGHVSSKLDIGFVWLCKFVIFLNLDKQWIFVLTSFIINFFVFKSIFESSKNPLISLIVFFLGTFFFFSMNGIRQSIAASIFYYSILYIKNRNLKKFILLNSVGILFHSSAIIFIPLYFILNHKFTRSQRILSIIILSLSLGVIGPKILDFIAMTKYSGYLINPEYNVGGTLTLSTLVNMFIYILFEFFERKEYEDIEYNIYLNMHYLGVIITILSTYLIIIFRLFLSFRFVEFLSIPYLFYYLKKNNFKAKNKIIIYIFVFTIMLGYFIYSIVIKNYNDTVPYHTVFDYIQNN